MEIYPAIDLYGGKVVRLTEGRFDSSRTYGEDPLSTAMSFLEAGAGWIHIIDLEGAEKGKPIHLKLLRSIAKGTGLPIQYGGGLRNEGHLEAAMDNGAKRLYLGSLIFRGDPWKLWNKFGTALVPSIDVKEGYPSISGWREKISLSPREAMLKLGSIGYPSFLVTSVSRDGTAMGPDLDLYRALGDLPFDVIAAGGIKTIADIATLRNEGLSGAVLGTSLYEKTLDLSEAIKEASSC